MSNYLIRNLDQEMFISLEQLGTKEKYWFVKGNDEYLYKIGRPTTGENWSEKICCELCNLIDLPHAQYEFASWSKHNEYVTEGTLSKSFVPSSYRLIHGNELLGKINPKYPKTQLYKVREYTPQSVIGLLNFEDFHFPPEYCIPAGFERSSDLFVGYLVFDCWVSNPDRHHENWGVILASDQTYSLAPTYDHGSALGCRENDEKRKRLMDAIDPRISVNTFVQKAKTPFYSKSGNRLTTLEVVQLALTHRPAAAKYWIDIISNIEIRDIDILFDKIPDTLISTTAKEFAKQIMEVNKRRLQKTLEDKL